jgi:hypothetical protein
VDQLRNDKPKYNKPGVYFYIRWLDLLPNDAIYDIHAGDQRVGGFIGQSKHDTPNMVKYTVTRRPWGAY